MQAVVVDAAGQPARVTEVPIPDPPASTVRVKVKAAGLNAIDNALAAGTMAEMMKHEYPIVLGRDAAGVVDAVGDGVTGFAVGDEVFGHVLLAPPIKAGTLAEYAILSAATVAAMPAGLDFVTAAAIPLAGAAAVGAVDAVDPKPGEAVLIVGASGGVGSFAVQLVAARGATVIATGLPEEADRLRGLGAAFVVDYREDVPAQVRAAQPDGVAALIDLVSYAPEGLAIYASLVTDGGRVASTLGATDADVLARRHITGTNIMAGPLREVIEPLAQQAAAGTLTVDISQVLPLTEAPAGLQTIAAGQATGKLVVRVAD